MIDVLYLAWRYLAYHRLKTCVLIAAITLIIYLPIGLNVLVRQSANQLTARAKSTPLLIGVKGSPLELVLRSLYFEGGVPEEMSFSEVARVKDSNLATAIPIHAKYQTQHGPIVGTSLQYFQQRQLSIGDGRPFAMLGECVLGASAAQDSGLVLGDSLMSTPESVFDLAGVYPLKMKVVGVLQPTGTPDDHAVFVDVKTAWVIAGLAHGHQDLAAPDAKSGVLKRDGQSIIANASVKQYNEITAANVGSFHFHGNVDEFPITAVLAFPQDDKSDALLQGRYLGKDESVHVVRPVAVMDELLATIFTVQQYVLVAVGVLTVATLASMALVFTLSLQLRRREMETIQKIGGSRSRVVSLVLTEIGVVLVGGAILAAILTTVTFYLADSATRWIVQMS